MPARKTAAKSTKARTSTTANKSALQNLQGQIDAIYRSQAVIEFDLDGNILAANDNFLNTLGYSLDEIQGKHHRILCDPKLVSTPEYADFWAKLNRGEFDSGEYKRFRKDGSEVWIQASYNPVLDNKGTPVKVVKFATDITEQKVKAADYQGQIDAVNKSQAVIEFNLDGTVITANQNFLNAVGYTLNEIQGKHHRLFCDQEYTSSPAYAEFWENLNRGEFDSGEYMRIGKGGVEIWIQASYNPIFDLNGKPTKVVKYATDITEQVKQRLEIERRTKIDSKNAEYQAREVSELSGLLEAIAKGDLSQDYQVAPGDEDTAEIRSVFSNIANAVNSMSENLRGLVRNLASNAGQLASTSQQLSSTANDLASGAEETTGQSATVAAAAEEMSTNMTNMAASTEEMTTNVQSVAKAVDELTASISEIAKTSEQASHIAQNATQLTESSNQTIGQLGEAAEEIGKVIEVIQDIAEQTNLLALNATIEAARAGEAGKGFAVVATEVKELARQTADATQDIRVRIEGIQSSTKEAVRSIADVGEAIQQVNSTSSTIASAVEEQSITTKEIAANVNQTASATTMVSTGVAESASACTEISRNIVGVDQAAKQTAQGASETQTVGSQLSELSEELQRIVGQFKVDTSTLAGAATAAEQKYGEPVLAG